jgi:hypothetical protein
MNISYEKTYTLGDGGIETFVTEQEKIISQRASKISSEIRGAEEALEALVNLVPTPYPFHTDDNHYENDLKVSFERFLADSSPVLMHYLGCDRKAND